MLSLGSAWCNRWNHLLTKGGVTSRVHRPDLDRSTAGEASPATVTQPVSRSNPLQKTWNSLLSIDDRMAWCLLPFYRLWHSIAHWHCLLACCVTMWRGESGHEVGNPYRKSYTLRIAWEEPHTTSSQALGRVMLCFVPCRSNGEGRAVPSNFALSKGVGGVAKAFRCCRKIYLPKYIAPMRRHVVACLAPPLAAFGNAVLSACVRLKSLDREERVSV
jgi:hypothetical protein